MRLETLVRVSDEVGRESSRNRKVEKLAAALKRMTPDEVPAGVTFLSGEIRQGRIGLGYASVREASPGSAAAKPSLSLLDVDAALERLAALKGSGAGSARLSAFRELLLRATREEQTFLIRLLIGELRQGAQEAFLIEAIAKAAQVSAASVRRAWMVAADAGAVARAALTEGRSGLDGFRLRVFSPVEPMLARTAEDVAEVLSKFQPALFDFKLDGARIQVHRSGEDVRVFSRRLNDVTAAVPEIVEAARSFNVREAVLDGEALVFEADGHPAPFQVTMRRFGRRLNVDEMRQRLPLTPFFFDALKLEGEDLIGRPARERLEALGDVVPSSLIVPRLETASEVRARLFLERALGAGHEGIMAKSLEASYEAGRRGANWLKIKPSHTLDLVVLAAEWGSGRRRGWLSNIHLGARDPKQGFVMLGKTFKGMTDQMLEWQTRRFLELETRRDEYTVFLRPQAVVEVAFDGVQESPQYPGRLALRFARVKRYRPDKCADKADTIDLVRAIYLRQRVKG
jgi:DNA ligase-1